MNKYIVRWSSGYGDTTEVIEASNAGEAEKYAWDSWNEEVQSNADYEAMEFTLENAEEYGLEEEHPDYKEEE